MAHTCDLSIGRQGDCCGMESDWKGRCCLKPNQTRWGLGVVWLAASLTPHKPSVVLHTWNLSDGRR